MCSIGADVRSNWNETKRADPNNAVQCLSRVASAIKLSSSETIALSMYPLTLLFRSFPHLIGGGN